MATSTMFTYLMVKGESGSTYTKLVDIKDFPDLGGAPETLETTTLSDKMQTNILGIQSMDAMEFTCNYTPEDYAKLDAIALADKDFAIWFGNGSSGQPDGNLGKFEFKGQLSVYIAGAGVNAVREMKVSIAASTEVKKASA